MIRAFLQKTLLERQTTLGGNPLWKEDGGDGVKLVIAKAEVAACEVQGADEPAQREKGVVAAKQPVVAAVSDDASRMPRAGSKLAMLVALLSRDGGATVEDWHGIVQMRLCTSYLTRTKFRHSATDPVSDRQCTLKQIRQQLLSNIVPQPMNLPS